MESVSVDTGLLRWLEGHSLSPGLDFAETGSWDSIIVRLWGRGRARWCAKA